MENGSAHESYALITGGAGFIGTNLAERLLQQGQRVLLLDDFSRPGVEANARYITELGQGRVSVVRGDCRNARRVADLVRGASKVFHLAAQVAVTTSLVEPTRDFDVNAGGTLNVLEAIRKSAHRPPLLFTSTNKVYGNLPDLELRVDGTRYEPADSEFARTGIDERCPLDFHSPYGCSKGAADQYVLDYARCFGLRSVVFRMSCIYGPHQCGNEDQGWVAHFLMRILAREPITIFGDGLQVRDVLYVGDLIDAMLLALDGVDEFPGRAFNVGGGPANAVSLREMIDRLGALTGIRPELRFSPARNGDQLYYVSNTQRLRDCTRWSPQTSVSEGVLKLLGWLTRSGASRETANSTADASRASTLRESVVEVR
jgi:CDP-paratose 2-epimerase